MADINLLPTLDKSQKVASNTSSKFKKAGTILSLLLILVLLVYASIYGYFYVNGTVTASSIASLETQIRAQEKTEQKIVLLRDRTTKIARVLSEANSEEELTSLSDILSRIPEGVELREAKVKPTEITVAIQANQSSQLTEFIRTLTESGVYSQIESTSMAYNPEEQYIAIFRVVLGQINPTN